jgi:5-methylcytosine-specific restriction endonuclease McrA
MSESGPKQIPSIEERRRVLRQQEHRCYYCERKFGSVVFLKNRKRTLTVNWDHCVPYCYSGDNGVQNFVAACRFCNGWKGSLMFNSLDEARVYLYGKWQKAQTERGTAVHGMLEAFPGE